MSMIVNALPSVTWNQLRVNQSEAEEIHYNGEVSLDEDLPAAVFGYREEANGEAAKQIGQIQTGMGEDMDALFEEHSREWLCLRVKDGQKVEDPARLHFHYQYRSQDLERFALDLEEGSALTLIMDYTVDMANPGSCGIQLKGHLGKNSSLTLYQIEMLGAGFTCMNDIGFLCEEGASVSIIQLFLGKGKIYTGCKTTLAGDKSSVKIQIGYQAGRESLLDMNYVAIHQGKETKSNLITSGVLRENAKKIFRGTIDFQTGSSAAVGDEKEEVLLLDEGVVNQTVPLILCAEEDVVGNHGATIGKVDEDSLFYLESRGISQAEVMEMLSKAKVEAICKQIEDSRVKEQAFAYLEGGRE